MRRQGGGLFEFTVIGLLAVVAVGFEPRLRGSALIAALSGLTLAAALALAGVGAINSGTVDLTDTGGRLSGSYGNANELGLAAALGLPIALAYISAPGRRRFLLGGVIAILTVTLVLTYSRGGIIAAGVGVLMLALWEARASRRRLAAILACAVLVAAAGAGLYSVFKQHRESASFVAVPVVLKPLGQRDVSGWDARALGPIPAGPSRLGNGEDGITVRGSRPGEGVSFRWGEAAPGRTYVLTFSARARRPGSRLEYALADRVAGGGTRASVALGRRRRRFSLAWHPGIEAPHASFYFWQPDRPADFALAGARVTERQGDAVLGAVVAPDRLRGSVYAHLGSDASRLEKRYVESRLDAARLAWRAFRSAPIGGIGWSSFPAYSAERADYGRLAAHDQYLLVAAELGLIGLVFMGLLLTAPIVAARRAPGDRPTAAAIGLLASAATGMLFVETFASPQISVPIALAAAVLCARPRPVS